MQNLADPKKLTDTLLSKLGHGMRQASSPATADSAAPEASTVYHFTPLPPAHNGIADYAYNVIDRFSQRRPCAVFCEDPFGAVPPNVAVLDPRQAYRFLDKSSAIVHQIGNNADHIFILDAIRRFSGLVVLHDIRLLFLHQLAGIASDELERSLWRSNRFFAASRAEDVALRNMARRSDHALFDTLGDIVDNASAILVHSEFARGIIARHYGAAAKAKLHVHPLARVGVGALSPVHARARMFLEQDDFVVVTSGFATRAKRYDWLVEALSDVAARHRRLIWVQAGPIQPDEFDLPALLARHPRVEAITRLVGYVDEADLNAYICAADLFVNMRFPSTGENSASLVRGLEAGVCCLVSDTASYREIPADAVIRISPTNAVVELVSVMESLIDDRSIGRAIGARAADYCNRELSMDRYVDRLEAILASAPRGTLSPQPGNAPVAPNTAGNPLIAQRYSLEQVRSRPTLGAAAGTHVRVRVGPLRASDIDFGAATALAPVNLMVSAFAIEPVLGGYDLVLNGSVTRQARP